MPPEIHIPGTQLEKAAGETISGAGKVLIKVMGEFFDRWTVRGNVQAKAEADEIAKDIAFEGDLRRARRLREARQEFLPVDAEEAPKLVQQAIGRLKGEWLHEAKAVNEIAQLAIGMANDDPEAESPRVPPDDWLIRFFQYAAKVDDEQLQRVMARVLADASIQSRSVASNRAIDAIRFLDRDTLEAFKFLARDVSLFGSIPAGYYGVRGPDVPQSLDLSYLTELGFIKYQRTGAIELVIQGVCFGFVYRVGEAFDFDTITLTRVGREVASLLYPEIRKRFASDADRLRAPLEIQTQLGLSEIEVKAWTVSAIQQMADRWGIEIDIDVRVPGAETIRLYTGERKVMAQPFNLGSLPKYRDSIDPSVRSLAAVVFDEFQYFDERQLPSLRPDIGADLKQDAENNLGPRWMTLRELFHHIHPLPFQSDDERDAVGQEIVDQIASHQLGVMGRQIVDIKRLAMEPIPAEVWARARFTYWFLKDGQDRDSLQVDCPTGNKGEASRQYADIQINREQAMDIWAYFPLKDAARMAYERSREGLFAKQAERLSSPSSTLKYFADALYLYHPVYGERVPSTLRELVPIHVRPSTRLQDDLDSIREINGSEPIYIHLKVSKPDLANFIEWARSSTLNAPFAEFEPESS